MTFAGLNYQSLYVASTVESKTQKKKKRLVLFLD